MKNILKLSLLAAALAAVPSPLLHATEANDKTADTGPRHPRLHAFLQKRAELRAKAAKHLALTADQIAQLKAKRSATVDALKAVRADTALTKEQKHAKAREILQNARTEMRSTLTPEQQAKLEKMKKFAHRHRRGPGL